MVNLMKTTVELSDDLLREVQRVARAEGTTMRSLMEEGLRAVLERYRSAREFRLREASVTGSGLRPDFAGRDWAQIRDASYGDRG